MKIKKMLAGLIILIFIWFILSFVNGFMGNPISKLIVNQAAQKYVEQNYPDLNLELDKAIYNFKDDKYYVAVKSKTSIDTHFSIGFTGMGKQISDNYKSVVLEKFNTWERLNESYCQLLDTSVENDFPYESEIFFGEILDKSQNFAELELDKEYDIQEIAREKGHIVLYITSNTLNEDNLTKTLFEVKTLFDQKQIPFYSIDLTLQAPLSEKKPGRESIQIENFLYQDIYEDGLSTRVQENIFKTKKYYEQMDKEKQVEIDLVE